MGGFGRRMGSREYKAFLSATVSPPQLPAGSPSSFLWMRGFLLMVTPPPPSPPNLDVPTCGFNFLALPSLSKPPLFLSSLEAGSLS